jgi:hypothetical protein
MPRKKKSWINKNTARSFFLVPASAADERNADSDEELPGTRLAPMEPNLNQEDKAYRAAMSALASEDINKNLNLDNDLWGRDHIGPMGFANNGYDYSRHLAQAEGGVFIAPNGKVADLPTSYGEDDSQSQIQSQSRIDTDLENLGLLAADTSSNMKKTITLSPAVMDEDLKAALFEDADDEGEFEVLDDDFIAQVIDEPENPDFDYDAHIAHLIAKSEQSISNVRPRGWSDVGDDDGDDESGEFLDVFDEEELKAMTQDKRAMEEQFQRTLEEYGENDMGYIDTLDGAQVVEAGGSIGMDTNDPRFLEVLEEFDAFALQKNEDTTLMNGVGEEGDNSVSTIVQPIRGIVKRGGTKVPYKPLLSKKNQPVPTTLDNRESQRKYLLMKVEKGAREVPSTIPAAVEDAEAVLRELNIGTEGERECKEGEIENKTPSALKIAELLQASYVEEAFGPEIDNTEIDKCQEYLREGLERPLLDWDCETILSTYSTLDNHPSVIGAPISKNKPRRRDLRKGAFGSRNGSSVDGRSNGDRKPSAPQRILLTSKLGIPRGYGAALGAGPQTLTTIDDACEDVDEGSEEEE